MVGRRLVACSDLDQFYIPDVAERLCNNIVNGITAVWNEAKKVAKDVADLAVNAANTLKETAENALDAVTGWFDDLGRDIQCVRAPSNPRSSPR